MNDQVAISLLDPETNVTYTCMVSPEDAVRAEADIDYAQGLLNHLISEQETQDAVTENTHTDSADSFRWAPQHVLLLIRLVESHEEMLNSGLKKKVSWKTSVSK